MNSTAAILDQNGVDVTSSFKIMIYHQPPNISSDPAKNLNDRDLTQFARLINACPAEETFIESHCAPGGDENGTLQRYRYTCRRVVDHYHAITGVFAGRRPAYRTREDNCDLEEICVDGLVTRTTAACVKHWVFDDYMVDKDGQLRGMLDGQIFNMKHLDGSGIESLDGAYSVMSLNDNSTSMTVDSLEIDAGVQVENGNVWKKRCRNCADLETDEFGPKVNSLRVEAKLLATAELAVGGVLWLALSTIAG